MYGATYGVAGAEPSGCWCGDGFGLDNGGINGVTFGDGRRAIEVACPHRLRLLPPRHVPCPSKSRSSIPTLVSVRVPPSPPRPLLTLPGGAERLVVDAALGLQNKGHHVHIYTSHHNPAHAFEETIDGRLRVHHFPPPFPRSLAGALHILFAHARQLHLVSRLLTPWAPTYDVFFVDQLSTCVPLLRLFARTRVVFYCHFPDKLLASGAFVDGKSNRPSSLLKRIYRFPMDWLEEVTTRQADVILVNSKFTARVFKSYFKSITHAPRVIYPGINISAYQADFDPSHPDAVGILSYVRFA